MIAPVAAGQPHFVAGPVKWAASLIATHPVAWDVPFAAVQLMIGLGLLVPRTAKLALAASLPWAPGVWFFGEGLSGLASGHASLLTGAPGSVLLYGVLALAAWPRLDASHEAPARWLRSPGPYSGSAERSSRRSPAKTPVRRWRVRSGAAPTALPAGQADSMRRSPAG